MAYSLRSIARGSAIYAFGQVLTKASAFLLIPLYTRFLTPDDYGIVGYLQFILQISSTILMFGFHGAQTRFFYEHQNAPEKIGEFLFSINVWLALILIPAALAVGLWGESIYALLGPEDVPYHPFVPVIIWTTVLQVMNQMIISWGVARKEYLKITVLQLLLFALTTGFAILLVVWFKMGAEGQVRAMLYGQIAFFALVYPRYARNFICRIKWEYIAYGLSFGVPIVFHLLSGVMHNSIDRAILADRVPLSELGLYTLGYQVGMVMSIVTASVNQAWQPSYYELMASADPDRDRHVRRTYNLWLMLMSVICMLGILWGGDVLNFVTPAQFHGAAKVIPFVFFGYFFNGLYFFGVSPVFFYKKTAWLPWLTGSAAAVNIGLNFLLIPWFGIVGAALATTISMLFQAVAVYLAGKRLHDHGYDLRATMAISILMGISFVGPLWVEDMMYSLIFRTGFLAIMCINCFFFFKTELESILNQWKLLIGR